MARLVSKLADVIVPRFCIHCESLLPFEANFLCKKCFETEPKLNHFDLMKLHHEKFHDGVITDLFSLAKFTHESPLRTLVVSLKYNDLYHAGKYLGDLIGAHFNEAFSVLGIDYIVPVPLHRLRMIERGFNQSEEIAKGISSVTGLSVEKSHLRRIRYTEAQVVTGSKSGREGNLIGAFKAKNPLQFTSKNILLVDDVITTGSTIREAAKALWDSGASNIYATSVLIA
ncbi:MAG: ComF family protein [Ignavibacteria bacterium]|nr:ComF family protein [Ignavibacteria bacterium]